MEVERTRATRGLGFEGVGVGSGVREEGMKDGMRL